MKVAVIQMQSSIRLAENLQRAAALIAQAAAAGARLAALPEYFACLGPPTSILAAAQPLDGPLVKHFRKLAQQHQIFLLLGSVPECSPVPGKIYNTAVLVDPGGEIVARYRKIHLFDINLPGQVVFRESDYILPGDQAVAVPLAGTGFTLGLSICYDLRFPELFRRLVDLGADLMAVPAAFSQATGRDHWEILLRARAIENQAFILAPAQYPHPDQGLKTYGRSMIIDPWGTVLATAPDQEGLILAHLDRDYLARRRRELPCLAGRRWPVGVQVQEGKAAGSGEG